MAARPPSLVHRLAAVVAAATLIGSGCHGSFDDSRTSVDTGTFGDTVLTLMCKRVAYLDDLADGGTVDVAGDAYRDICRLGLAPPADASGSMKALLAERDRLVGAVDGIFPEEFLPDLQTFLTSNQFLALYDDDTSVRAIDAFIEALRYLADDDAAVEAMERLGHRLGYRPLTPALGAVRALVRYPELHELLLTLTEAITPGGGARGEWDNLIEAAGAALRNAEPAVDPDASDRTLTIALDFLLRERTLLGTSRTIPLTLRDYRGVAAVARPGGSLPAPFVDTDGDLRADVDSLGRYVDATGTPIAAPAPFELPDGLDPAPWAYRDTLGRALTSDGGPLLYQYVDLDKTVLAALARDGISLFDPQKGTAFDLVRGASALVGPRVNATHTYPGGETLDYRGYDTTASPLLDMSYGYLQLLRDPAIYDTLALARTLMQTREPQLAQLVEAVVSAARKGDNHPEAAVAPDAPLWDDMMPVIKQILDRPALVDALMRAMERPEVAQLGERFRKYMLYRDRFDINPNTQAVTGSFATPVDRSRIDNAYDRSLFQRLLHLIADSNHAQLCNKNNAHVVIAGIQYPFIGGYAPCELVQIDNLAVFYVQSIVYAKNAAGQVICENAAGDQTVTVADGAQCYARGDRPRPKATMVFKDGLVAGAIDLFGDDFLESQSTITGFRRHRTPPALNRVLLLDPMPSFLSATLDPVRDREGDLYTAQHAGTLPVWEKENFYDQIRPIAQAFADNNAEQLFVDFMAVLHKHWASEDSITHQTVDPNAPGYVYGSNARTYEPLIIDMLADGTLMGALVGTAPSLDQVTANGKSYATIVRTAARYLVSPQAGLADRSGATTTTTSDGRPVNQLSPWHILADAYNLKRDRLAMAGAEGVAWTDSISEVVDVLFRGADVAGQGWRFRNPRTRGETVALVDLITARLQAHDAAGDRTAWLTRDLPGDIEAKVTSPVFAGIADFILSLQATPETRLQLESLVQYLVDEAVSTDSFNTALTSLADLAQLALDDGDLIPIAQAVGEIIRPERGWLEPQLIFVREARRSDDGRALSRMMVNLYQEHLPGRTPVGDLVDGLTEVVRARPYDDLGKRFTADDYRASLRGVADFLDEEKRGLRKFIAIIKSRNL